jgi:hypothetical protein
MHVLTDIMHRIFFYPSKRNKKRSALWTVFLTVLLASCGGSKTPAPPQTIRSGATVRPDYFGMHLQCVVSPCENDVVYPYPSTLGFTTIRLWDTISWSTLEPTAEHFDWRGVDALINQATANGVTSFVFTLGSVPAWASSNPTGDCGNTPAGQCYPPSLPAMDGFLTTLVQRECGLVTYYEAWNEADMGDFWRGTNTQLLAVVQHLEAIVKNPANCGCSGGVCSPGGGLNPNRVLTPSVNSICTDSGRQWLTDWFRLTDRSGVYGDVVSFHGYECQPESIYQPITWLRSLADAHGLTDAEIWDTEASWGKEETPSGEPEASWLMRSYVTQAASGVSRFYWYAYGSCSWGSLYGPSCGGSPGHQVGMREAGIAYSTVSKWLRGATIEACNSDNEQTWSCTLTRPNGYKGVIMWNASSSIAVQIPARNLVEYRDWQNTTNPLGEIVNVSPMPILLENQNAS